MAHDRPPHRFRPDLRRLCAAALGALLLAAAGAGPAARVLAESRILRGGPPPPVRVIRGGAPSPVAVEAIDLADPAPLGTDSLARALARRMVDAYGGPASLAQWVERGERRGRQSILAPVRVDSRFVERRDGARRRIDFSVAGAGLAFGSGPEGTWQSFMGLVSDLPEREREELRVAEAHDERLLLSAARGALPAQADPGAAGPGEIALVVWGPRGSATRFRADATTGQPLAIEFVDLDPRGGEGEAPQARLLEGWTAVGPDRAPLLAPRDGMVPLVARDRVDEILLAESVIDTLDLGRAFADSVFARPGSSAATLGPSRRAVVPLLRRGDHHYADVRVGSGPARRFLVDTGAGMTAVSEELAGEAAVAAGESLEVVGLGGGTMARVALLPPLVIGAFTLREVRGLVLDLSELRHGLGADLDGILGISALARYAVTFDFARGQLELAENAVAGDPGPGGARVPFEMVGGQVIVPVRVDGGEEASFLVDSGAWRTFLPPEVGARLGIPPERRLPGIPSSGADGRPIEAEALRVRSLAIGALEVERPIVLVPAGEGAGTTAWSLATRARGVLGADILRRFRVTIDFPRQELTLEPVRPAPSGTGEESFSGPGIVLGAGTVGGGAPVRRVLAGSPAERAGLRVGDRVTAIDGAATGGVRAELLRQRLGGPPGSAVQLTLREGSGRERVVRLERALLL